MAGRGPARKRPEDRVRRNTDYASTLEVSPDGELHGPDLPEGDWPGLTLAWWLSWRLSPQAATFTTTDWQYLLETALIHAQFAESGSLNAATELRLRVAKFGATPADRMSLGIVTKADPTPNAAKPAGGAKSPQRNRLLHLVEQEGQGA